MTSGEQAMVDLMSHCQKPLSRLASLSNSLSDGTKTVSILSNTMSFYIKHASDLDRVFKIPGRASNGLYKY